MERVSISKLKDQLSAYLKKVEKGQSLVVTDRNRPVARVTPIVDDEQESERVARLVAQGLLTLPKGPPVNIGEILRRRPVIKGAGVLEALLEERREGR